MVKTYFIITKDLRVEIVPAEFVVCLSDIVKCPEKYTGKLICLLDENSPYFVEEKKAYEHLLNMLLDCEKKINEEKLALEKKINKVKKVLFDCNRSYIKNKK